MPKHHLFTNQRFRRNSDVNTLVDRGSLKYAALHAPKRGLKNLWIWELQYFRCNNARHFHVRCNHAGAFLRGDRYLLGQSALLSLLSWTFTSDWY